MKGTLSVFKQVNDLQMQIAAKSSRKYASPQPAATISPESQSRRSAHALALEKVGALLAGAQFTTCGPVSGHEHLKQCSSMPDVIGRHLLVEYCGRHELWNAHHDFEQGRGKVKQGYSSSGKCFRRHETSSTEAHALEIAALAQGGYLTPCSKYDWVWRHTREQSRQA